MAFSSLDSQSHPHDDRDDDDHSVYVCACMRVISDFNLFDTYLIEKK